MCLLPTKASAPIDELTDPDMERFDFAKRVAQIMSIHGRRETSREAEVA
jgi:hypothetical protein